MSYERCARPSRGRGRGGLLAALAVAVLAWGCGSSATPARKDSGPDAQIDSAPPVEPDAATDMAPSDGPAADAADDVGAQDAIGADGAAPEDGAASDGGPDAASVPDGAGDASAGDGGLDAEPLLDTAPDVATPDSGPDLGPPMGPLLAHWPLDEGTGVIANDTSGNGNTGMLMNGATWTTSGFPTTMFANPGAVVLDGVSQFVELGTRALPPFESPRTVSLWFWQMTSTTTPGRKNIIAMTSANSGVQLGLDVGRVSVWASTDPGALVVAPAAAAAGWHHVAYTYAGGVHQLYVDNQLIGQTTHVLTPEAVAVARLGAYDRFDEMFGGRIDDVRIYDHVLDAAAIATLAGGGAP